MSKRCAVAIMGCLWLAALFVSACARHPKTSVAQERAARSLHSEFIDLQSGWRVWMVVPMLRSGGYTVPLIKKATDGDNVNIEAGDDFLGYEKAYYNIASRPDGGIRIRFSHAEVRENGKTYKRSKPLLSLFDEATQARFVRLVYLTRVSAVDHDMAILSSSDHAALDNRTQLVTENGECPSAQNAACIWVPNGVAVTPEVSKHH